MGTLETEVMRMNALSHRIEGLYKNYRERNVDIDYWFANITDDKKRALEESCSGIEFAEITCAADERRRWVIIRAEYYQCAREFVKKEISNEGNKTIGLYCF